MCGMFTSLGLIGLSRMTMPAELISNTEKELNIKITKNSSVTSYKTGKSTLTVFIPVKDINDEQLAKKVSEYLKNKTDENTGTINVLLYKFASFGNASLLKSVYILREQNNYYINKSFYDTIDLNGGNTDAKRTENIYRRKTRWS